MDLLAKVRKLLHISEPRKRKASDDFSETSFPSGTKKLRDNSSSLFFNDRPHDVMSEHYRNLEQLNKQKRHSGSFLSNSSLARQRAGLSSNCRVPSNNFTNGNVNLIENFIEQNSVGRNSIPSLQTTRTRQIPGLLKPNLRPSYQPSGSVSNGWDHLTGACRPNFTMTSKYSNIPELKPIQRSNFNSRIHDSSRYGRSGAFGLSSEIDSMNLKRNVEKYMQTKHLRSPAHDKRSYKDLLKLIPGLSKYTTPNFENKKPPDVQEIIDLSNDEASTSSLSNVTKIEPVNSLKTRMETVPVYNDNWLEDLNAKYDNINLNRSSQLKLEQKKNSEAEKQTKAIEKSFTDRVKAIKLDDAFVYEIIEDEEEEAVNDFPPLSNDQKQKLSDWISGRDTHTILTTKFNLNVSREDIQTLNWSPLTWLNDNVINFYMELLAERSKLNDSLPKVHAMNTFFLTTLMRSGYSSVRRWTRKVDIFSFDIVPVPVHKGVHWCMAIIHMKNKTIKYYDSMGAPDNAVLNALTNYLGEESRDKKKCEFDWTGWSTENVRDIPQQENGSDCGVFSCMFAEFITRDRPLVFSQQHMQYFRMRMVYEICTGKLLA